jgi:hypothetical protein
MNIPKKVPSWKMTFTGNRLSWVLNDMIDTARWDMTNIIYLLLVINFMILIHDSFLCLNCEPAFQSWSGMGSTGLWSFNPVLSSSKNKISLLAMSSAFQQCGLERALYRKSNLCIPRNETAQPRSQFLCSCICEQFIYSQDLSAYLAAAK